MRGLKKKKKKKIPSSSENKPRGLYFSKALFEELNYIRRGLSMKGNLICVSKSIGLAL